jgi:transcriptional regulator with XRE-family HTH domain
MELRDILARNVRSRRRVLGLSQEELAHRASVDRTYVSSLERGVYAATIDMVERLAMALETEAWELLRP